jgi:natural product biosynthesis luciferase-like monooxygenase protein
MSDLEKRLAALSPQKRALLERELKRKQLSVPLSQNSPGAYAAASHAPRTLPDDEIGAWNNLTARPSNKRMQFSLFFFSDDGSSPNENKYALLLESAKFADAHNYAAVWTPERHFQDFGGLYPNPSVLSAALAMITERIQIRAGSVALPLHNPIRVAEEWSVVDNLSKGRASVSFASGWHPLDFILAPDNYENRRDVMFENIGIIRRLWSGESVAFKGVGGNRIEVRILPRPVQPELPIWVTIAGDPQTWIKAGEIGAHVLTAILRETMDTLRHKINLYRDARARHGHDPDAGQVAVMLHTFVGESNQWVKEQIKEPMCQYFRTNMKQLGLQKDFLMNEQGIDTSLDMESMIDSDLQSIVSFAFERYFNTSLLCGTPDKCAGLIERLIDAGVDEAACLIDFGVSFEPIMESLHHLNTLKEYYSQPAMV